MPLKVQFLDPTQKITGSERKEEDCDQTVLVMYKTTVSDKKFITCRRKTLNITVIKDIVVLQR